MRNMRKAGEGMNRYDVCIFDLDGTLIDSLGDLADSCNRALRLHGMPVHDIDKYRYFVGSGIKNLIRRSLAEKGSDEKLVDSVFLSFNSIYEANCLVRTKPYSNIKQMLMRIKQQGVKVCVLSNKSDEFSKMITDRLFDEGTFDIVWGKKPDYPIKPDPTSLHAMLDMLSMSREKCLYIGDSDVDCITAQNAGVDFMGVEWGFRGREELLSAGAKVIASSPWDIAKAVCGDE